MRSYRNFFYLSGTLRSSRTRVLAPIFSNRNSHCCLVMVLNLISSVYSFFAVGLLSCKYNFWFSPTDSMKKLIKYVWFQDLFWLVWLRAKKTMYTKLSSERTRDRLKAKQCRAFKNSHPWQKVPVKVFSSDLGKICFVSVHCELWLLGMVTFVGPILTIGLTWNFIQMLILPPWG